MSDRIGARKAAVLGAVTALACAGALLVPSGASAWKWVFQDFFDVKGGGIGFAYAVAKKCKGGKLGYYKFESRAGGSGGDTEFEIEVTLDLPVFNKEKPLKDVNVAVKHSANFDEATVIAIVNAYTDFWEGGSAEWSPGEITFHHPELVVFGNQILSEGVHKEDFEPKDKC